jgi:hypothetical protein
MLLSFFYQVGVTAVKSRADGYLRGGFGHDESNV